MRFNPPHHFLKTVRQDEKAVFRWWHAHLILGTIIIVVIVAILATASSIAYHALTAQQVRSMYAAPQVPPKGPARVSLPPVAQTVPSSFALDLSYMPDIGNQDGIGACQSWAIDNYQLAYAMNKHYGYAWGKSIKPKRLSARFSNDYATNGIDIGTNYFTVVNQIQNIGVPLWKVFPYGNNPVLSQFQPPLPAYGDEPIQSIPSGVLAAAQKYNLNVHVAFYGEGPGSAGVQALKDLMSKYKLPADINIEVYPTFDDASFNPVVGLPPKGTPTRGGHAVTLWGWNDSILVHNADGTTSRGAFLGINQWTKAWGGTKDLQPNNGTNGGYFAISYKYVEKYAWAGAVAEINFGSTSSSLKGYKNPHPGSLEPPPTTASTKPSQGSGAWYVRGVYTRDLGGNNFDLATYINAIGDKYGIAPVGIAATLGAECGLNTGGGNHNYLNDDCSRYGYWPDVSFGACQLTVQTAGGLGYGDGSGSGSNENYVHLGLENYPTICVTMAGQLLSLYKSYTGLQYPYLSVAWNCGPGWSASQLVNPYSISYQCGYNFFNDFMGWYNYSLSHWATTNPPNPTPTFPKTKWEQYRREHREWIISPYYGKSLSLFAQAWLKFGPNNLGGTVNQYQYSGYGYAWERFQGGTIWVWPHHPRYVPKFKKESWIK